MSGVEGVERFHKNIRELDEEIEQWAGKIHAALHMAAHGGVQGRIRPVRDTGDTESRVRSWVGRPTGSEASHGSPEAARAAARISAAKIRKKGLVDSGVELNVPWGGKLEFGRGSQRPLMMFTRTHQHLHHSGLAKDA